MGQLLFVANAGRPDVAHSVSLLSRFLKDPREVHLKGAHRVMQYLFSTRSHGLKYMPGGNASLIAYSDASHGNKNDLPYATAGYLVKLSCGIITWSSKKIKSTITLSSSDAEYIAGGNTCREIIWLNNML